MYRHTLIVFLILLALLAGPITTARAMPAAAPDSAARAQADPDALTRLSRYLRPDTLVYAAMRTDAASFAQLDYALARLQAALPSGTLDPGLSLRIASLFSEATDEDFTTAIRPWLGDAAALAIYPPGALAGTDHHWDNDVPVLLAVAITDRNAAAGFVARNASEWTRTDYPAYTVFTPRSSYDTSGVLIRDDVLIVASYADVLPLDGVLPVSLADHRPFTQTIALLPGPAYHILAYADLPMAIAHAVGEDSSLSTEERLVINAIIRMIGPEAAGIAVRDERALIMDIVQPVGNITALETLGLAFTPGTPLDPAFLNHVPANAALVLHGTNPGALADTLRDVVGALTGGGPLQGLIAEAISHPFEALFSTLTGLSYQHDLAPWLAGDYAVFASYNPLFNFTLPVGVKNWPLDVGLVFETADPAATQHFLARLERELQLALRVHAIDDVTITREMINGLPVLVATIYEYGEPLLDILAVTDGAVILFGTRGATAAMLDPNAARFSLPLQYALPNAELSLIANTGTAMPLIALLDYAEADPDLVDVLGVLARFAGTVNATLSSLPDGGIVLRLALIVRP